MKKLIAILMAFVLPGCSMLHYTQPNKTNVSGAGGIFKEPSIDFLGIQDSYSSIDYCDLLLSYSLASKTNGYCKVDISKVTSIDPKLRDEVQDYIIALSNQKCGEYFRLLHSMRADSDVIWGSLSTLLSGAGAVLSHAPTASAFAASGAASSGIRAELNQAYFSNLALEVMTSGISSRREKVSEKIYRNRANHGTNSFHYSLTGAIGDALEYHNACNAVTGFEVAAQAITRSDNPGALEIKKFIEDLGSSAKVDFKIK